MSSFNLVSPECQLSELPNSLDFSAGEIEVEIAKVGLQVFKRLPLRPVIGVALQVAEPMVLILPIDIFGRFHGGY